MGLLQKRPEIGENFSLYSLGLNKTALVVGLGNPGPEYELTRHNLGFICLDRFAEMNNFPAWINKKDLNCLLTQETLGDTRVILIKPTTFMNSSGEALSKVTRFYKIDLKYVCVVHDELDIPFGQIRTRVGGSAAGHNGIKSIIEHLGETFGRVRIGIGSDDNEGQDSSAFVLGKLTSQEQEKLPELKREVAAILSEWIFSSGQPLPHETRSFLI
jgi:PTH1 family peptidyl-tRNA hydrolase